MLAVSACSTDNGNGSENLVDFLPASGEVTGWAEDTTKGEAGPEVTSDEPTAVVDWALNGALEKFVATGGWKAVAREFYINASDDKIALYIHEMSTSTVGDAYDVIKEDYASANWQDYDYGAGQTLGAFGAVYTYGYAIATKGKYFVDATVEPAAIEDDAKTFLTAVLNKIP
jgi:hypothetical protein